MLSCASTAVMAQDSEPVVQSGSLRLWPEYDDPGLLVIASGSFGESTALPFSAAFPLPEGTRGIQATVNDPTKGLMNRQWSVSDGKLVYDLDLPDYHFEYYVDRPPSGEQREIRYTFEAPYRMNALEVAVQQPARATDFSLEPAPTGSYVGSDGLTYYTFTKDALAPGEKLDIAIRYSKNDNALTSASPVVAATQPAAAPASAVQPTATAGTPDWLPYALIGAGILGVAAVTGYYLLQQRQTRAASARTKAPRPTVTAESIASRASATSISGVFCTQCGRRFGADERFCAQCGTPRRA